MSDDKARHNRKQRKREAIIASSQGLNFGDGIIPLDELRRIEELSDAIHYPGCWDTVTYPTLLDAVKEIGCNPLDCVQGSIDIGDSDE